MTLKEHAKRELEMAGYFDETGMYNGDLGKYVMELIEVFSNQGHSGASAGFVNSLFSKLANYEIINPLTGKDDEWFEYSDGQFQNKRDGAVFKDGKEGKAYYLDAIVWKDELGNCWSGSRDGVTSRQFIKSFPFVPKTFTIDSMTDENGNEHIKNLKDLDAVWEHYIKYN